MAEIALTQLQAFIRAELKPEQYKDYCPNGLQVEGKAQVKRLALGVTASMGVIEQASAWQADALLVHHGYFWKGEDPCIVGVKRKRLQALWASDMSLLAYHLPLDVHPTLGNNAQLAKRLDWQVVAQHRVDGVPGLLWMGELQRPMQASELADKLTSQLGQKPLVVGPVAKQPNTEQANTQEPNSSADPAITTLAWCTGAAQRYFQTAIDLGATAYLSGEISENTVHLARETGIPFFACGHHATEKYGVQALGEKIGSVNGIEVRFFDEHNPV